MMTIEELDAMPIGGKVREKEFGIVLTRVELDLWGTDRGGPIPEPEGGE